MPLKDRSISVLSKLRRQRRSCTELEMTQSESYRYVRTCTFEVWPLYLAHTFEPLACIFCIFLFVHPYNIGYIHIYIYVLYQLVYLKGTYI